jgi:hypothetical protein
VLRTSQQQRSDFDARACGRGLETYNATISDP